MDGWGETEGGDGKKIIHMPEDKCIFSTCLIPCPHPQPSLPLPSFRIPQSSHIIPSPSPARRCLAAWHETISVMVFGTHWTSLVSWGMTMAGVEWTVRRQNGTFYFSLLPSLFKSHYGQTGVLFSWLGVNGNLVFKMFSARNANSLKPQLKKKTKNYQMSLLLSGIKNFQKPLKKATYID